nr:MAG TPA: hypothetical protein [Caudoviricetes sp.]
MLSHKLRSYHCHVFNRRFRPFPLRETSPYNHYI